MTLGVIFFIIILFGIYFVIADPLNLKPLLFNSNIDQDTNTTTNNEVSNNSQFSESQEAAMKKFGIDPASIPTNFTAEQEVCFEEKLGIERVNEIKSGGSPTATEFFKVRGCL